MRFRAHTHVKHRLAEGHPLQGRTLYVPALEEASARLVAAAFRWAGVEARETPPSTNESMEIGRKFTNGDECYPAQVTFGDLLKLLEEPDFDPSSTAFLMAAADGPCRFGQYSVYLREVLKDLGHQDIPVISPTDRNGYSDLGDIGGSLLRTAWRCVVAGDILRDLLLKTRAYEQIAGETEKAYQESIADLCDAVANGCADADCQLGQMRASLRRARTRFRTIQVTLHKNAPLIGVVGEIYCRLNEFSNQELVRRAEECGAEIRISGIGEWVEYANSDERSRLAVSGRTVSLQMLGAKVRQFFQHRDKEALLEIFHEDMDCYEEPPVAELIKLAEPYLPANGVCGEMVMSVGKAAYLALNGADGIIDISPFTCMNGIVSEAVYPKLSADYGGIPIRSFYFDGTQTDLNRDLVIFLEMARAYGESKRYPRRYPKKFERPVSQPEPETPASGAWAGESEWCTPGNGSSTD